MESDNTLIRYAIDPAVDYTSEPVYIEPEVYNVQDDIATDQTTPLDTSPVQPELSQAAATTETATITVRGAILNIKTDEPVYGVKLSLLDSSNKLISSIVLADNSNDYTAWTDQPDTAQVMFEKPGFQTTVYKFSDLISSSNVYLIAGNSKNIVTGAVIAIALFYFALKKKKNKVGALTTAEIIPFIVIAVAILGLNLVNKLLQKLGINAGPGTQGAQAETTDAGSEWKPAYWQQFPSYTYTINTEQATNYADTLHNAFGVLSDDYNAVLSVFSQMRTKANVSFLADVFQRIYSEDLLSFLQDGGGILPWDGLSESHLKTIIDLVNNLPSH